MITASDRLSVLSRVTEIAEEPHDYSSRLCGSGMEDLPLPLDTARPLHMLQGSRMRKPRQASADQERSR